MHVNISCLLRMLVFLGVIGIAGCAGFTETKRLVMLDEVQFLYERALMAGKYRAATKFMKTDEAYDPPDFEYLKDIKLSDYVLIDKRALEDGLRAFLTVEIKYFHGHYLIEKTLTDRQEWAFDPDDDQWYLKSGLPDFK